MENIFLSVKLTIILCVRFKILYAQYMWDDCIKIDWLISGH